MDIRRDAFQPQMRSGDVSSEIEAEIRCCPRLAVCRTCLTLRSKRTIFTNVNQEEVV